MDFIIKVENLSKKYRIFRQKEGLIYSAPDNFRDELINTAKKPFQWLSGQKTSKEDVWALKNISFKIEPGEILGIIGPNGAELFFLLAIIWKQFRVCVKGQCYWIKEK